MREGKLEYSRLNIKKGTKTDDIRAFEMLINMYLAQYPDKNLEKDLKIKQKIIALRTKYVQTNDAFLLNYIKIEEGNLTEKTQHEVKLDQILINFTRILNLREIPNKKQISVVQFKEMEALCQSLLKNQK